MRQMLISNIFDLTIGINIERILRVTKIVTDILIIALKIPINLPISIHREFNMHLKLRKMRYVRLGISKTRVIRMMKAEIKGSNRDSRLVQLSRRAASIGAAVYQINVMSGHTPIFEGRQFKNPTVEEIRTKLS